MPQRTKLAQTLLRACLAGAGPALAASGTFTFVTGEVNVQRKDGQRVASPGRITIAVGGKQPGLSGTADAATTMVLTADLELTGAPKPVAP